MCSKLTVPLFFCLQSFSLPCKQEKERPCLVSSLTVCIWKHSGMQRSCDPPDPGSSCGSRKPLPCWGAPSPHTSPLSALGSSLGRLSAEPGRRQSPCPGTQPLGHSRDPALQQPWAPGCTPGCTACRHPGTRSPQGCALTMKHRSPQLEQVFLHIKETWISFSQISNGMSQS